MAAHKRVSTHYFVALLIGRHSFQTMVQLLFSSTCLSVILVFHGLLLPGCPALCEGWENTVCTCTGVWKHWGKKWHPWYNGVWVKHHTCAPEHTQVGLEAARTLDDKACWEKLADAALAQGNHQVRISEEYLKLVSIMWYVLYVTNYFCCEFGVMRCRY